MKHTLRYISAGVALFMALLCCNALLFGQAAPRAGKPIVRAVLRPDSISVGDHFRLEVMVEKDMMQLIDFPNFENKRLGDDIVIIRESPVDTAKVGPRGQRLSKEYLLTCFREGYYNIGVFPVLFADKNIVDTLYSQESLQLLVTTFPVDTTMNTIFDIKAPAAAPVLVSEFSGYLKWTFVGLCLLAAMVWLIVRAVVNRRRKSGDGGVSRPRELPHVRAIRELEETHNQKLWQNNKHKLYYTRITDTLREYIEGRYRIGAMEMTSDEIVAAMAETELSEKNRNELREILYTADLVKFAKHIPSGDDNERIYYAAYYFVEETKEVPDDENEMYKPLESPDDEQ